MKPTRRIVLTFALAAATACSASHDEADQQASAVTVSAAGAIPAGLPAHMMVGLFENPGQTWMKGSGVPWDVRYAYFTYGWANNWGYGAHDGSWGANFMSESGSEGYVPAIQYYVMNGEPGGSEGQFLAKTQNAATMAEYFGDFKILLQRIKAYGKPVLVLLEADGFGFLEQQTGANPNAYAAVAASGVPELASLPNTVAGWGMAFLQLRKSVGATNAVLGVHVSAWASGQDIAYGNTTTALGPEVDKVYEFLAPLGVAANQTGATFDLLVGDPLDRDSDYYKLVLGQNRWWDPSDSASVSSMSFNRYAAWLQLWNAKAGKRWVLWQIPLGNSNHLDVCNSGGSRQGYKDNRPEYFFGSGTAHAASWANAGVIGLLFGAGAGCQSSYGNDTYTDGKSFIQSRVGSFYAGGGLPLAGGGGGSSSSSSGGSSSSSTGSSSSDGARYNFETGAQGWTVDGGAVASSTTQAFAGTHALAVSITTSGAASHMAKVLAPSTPAGATVTFHVWIPSGSALSSVQPFVLQGASGSWAWTGAWQPVSALKTNAWNTFTVTVPSNAATPLYELGVQFSTSGAWSGTTYVDAVTW